MSLAPPFSSLLHPLRKPEQSETSRKIEELQLSHIQAVHRPRPQPSFVPKIQLQLRQLEPFKQKVTATCTHLAALEAVVAPLQRSRATGELSEDIAARFLEYLALSGYERAEATLSLVHSTSCPRFHADYVKVRGLCTYIGPGTIWTDNSNVPLLSRLMKVDGGLRLIDTCKVHQAEPCDMLYLKGRDWPGNPGMGAIHRSPEGASQHSPRLLLTLDRAPDCDCGQD